MSIALRCKSAVTKLDHPRSATAAYRQNCCWQLKNGPRSTRFMTATATLVRLGVKKRRLQAPQRPNTTAGPPATLTDVVALRIHQTALARHRLVQPQWEVHSLQIKHLNPIRLHKTAMSAQRHMPLCLAGSSKDSAGYLMEAPDAAYFTAANMHDAFFSSGNCNTQCNPVIVSYHCAALSHLQARATNKTRRRDRRCTRCLTSFYHDALTLRGLS